MLEPPANPARFRTTGGQVTDSIYERYLRDRILAFPDLSGARLLREIREMGYEGGP